MKYLFKDDDNFGFKDDSINKILETDVQISDEIYDRYFKEQAEKDFKIKNVNGTTFEEIFEEIILEPIDPGEIEPSPIEKLQAENAELKKQVEDTQKSLAEMMNLIAIQATP